jgi:hypothetical protein
MRKFWKKNKEPEEPTRDREEMDTAASESRGQTGKKQADNQLPVDDVPAASPVKTKKITPRRLLLFLVLPAVIAAAAWVGYSWFFADREPRKPVYKNIQLAHVSLPEEMRRFCFEQMPDLYNAFVAYNEIMVLFAHEIARIDVIGQKYPEQQKIAAAEKKVWERAENNLSKAFLKTEEDIRQLYVLYQVNQEEGLAMIQEKRNDLTQTAQTALTDARTRSEKIIHPPSREPEGFIRGMFYNLKKKFL